LKALEDVIQLLPASIPLGTSDGKIARYFSDLDLEPDEGPWFTVDRAYTRVFQLAAGEELSSVITRGEYGLNLVFNVFKRFATENGMEKDGNYQLMSDRISKLLGLIANVYVIESYFLFIV
jgi:hypothetical protein